MGLSAIYSSSTCPFYNFLFSALCSSLCLYSMPFQGNHQSWQSWLAISKQTQQESSISFSLLLLSNLQKAFTHSIRWIFLYKHILALMKANSHTTSQAEKADAVKTFRQSSDGIPQLWPAAQTATAVLTPWVKFIPVPVSLILGLEKAVEGQF